jgi:hypothetical protein
MLPGFDRAARIGEFWGHPETRTFGELLIDLEEDLPALAAFDDDAAEGSSTDALILRAFMPIGTSRGRPGERLSELL